MIKWQLNITCGTIISKGKLYMLCMLNRHTTGDDAHFLHRKIGRTNKKKKMRDEERRFFKNAPNAYDDGTIYHIFCNFCTFSPWKVSTFSARPHCAEFFSFSWKVKLLLEVPVCAVRELNYFVLEWTMISIRVVSWMLITKNGTLKSRRRKKHMNTTHFEINPFICRCDEEKKKKEKNQQIQ